MSLGPIASTTRRGLLHLALATSSERPRRLIVVVYLRGGADGLSLVVPHADPHYCELRPSLAIPPPGEDGGALALDDRFGLHPGLRPLKRWWDAGDLAVVHAVGSDDQTRSHFEAQDRMEQAGRENGSIASGWVARHLRARAPDAGALQAVAIGVRRPESLRGAPAAAVILSAREYELATDDRAFSTALAELYGGPGSGPLGQAGIGALDVLDRIGDIPASGSAERPTDAFEAGLHEVASLVTADIPVEAACIDVDGWDTHFVQATGFDALASRLARGLDRFATDLGEHLERATVVVMSEFGRRAYENTSLGTDHGRAGVMLVLGRGIAGGRVYGDWPGLGPGELEAPGDLRVTTDYRDVLAEIVRDRLGNANLGDVFPGWTPRTLGLVRSAA